MFLLSRPLQLIINIAVIALVVSAIALGAVMILPARSPIGPLMGRMASDVDLLTNILANTEPETVAQALNENPQFISELLNAMVEEETVPVVAQAINDNPDFLVAVVPYLDPESIAYIVNNSSELVIGLVGYLDPAVIAEAVKIGRASCRERV